MSSGFFQYYEHLTTHIIPGPNSITYFIPLILLPCALLIPPSTLSNSQLSCVFLPLIYACIIHTWIWGGGIDVISANVALWATDLIALQDPRGTYRWVHISGLSPPQPKDATFRQSETEPLLKDGSISKAQNDESQCWEKRYPEKFYGRFSWVLVLLISIRLSYWKIGDPQHDKAQPPSRLTRAATLRRAASIIVYSFLVLDSAAFIAQFDPYFTDSAIGIDTPLSLTPGAPVALTFLSTIPPRLYRSSIIAAHIYGVITLGGALAIPLIVAVNYLGLIGDLWSIPFFGPFSAVVDRGMRGLWGTWWHQTMRYTTSIPGRRFAQACGVKSHSTLDYSLRTISAFFFSGVIHMGLVPPEPQYATMPAMTVRLYIAMFFWAQAVAFAIELLVSRIVKRVSPDFVGTSVAKGLTLIWVSAWLCITVPIVAVALKELGYGTVYPIPVSLWNGLARRGWLTWP